MLEREFLPEGGLSPNPLLHMGMHMAIHEQPQANRPAGTGHCAGNCWSALIRRMIWSTG